MERKATAGSIDDYIAVSPPEARRALADVRAIVRETAPGATETISYGMPTFDVAGRHLVHFAAYTHHIGFYPVPAGDVPFADEVARYWNGKGTARFPLGEPLPSDLIRRIVEYRLKEVAGGR